jgi:hypothetical protein
MATRIARASARSLLTADVATATACLLVVALSGTAQAGDSTSSSSQHSHGYSMGFHVSSSGHSDFQYAIIEDGSNTTCSISDEDAWQAIRKLQQEAESTGQELMWFGLDGKNYALRDHALIDRAKDIVRPMNELGRQQGELGRQQGDLGRKQGELGRLEGRIGQLEGRFAQLEATSSVESRTELEDLRQQLNGLRADARELGARQRELGERQRSASREAMIKLQSLAEDTVKSGKAERLED